MEHSAQMPLLVDLVIVLGITAVVLFLVQRIRLHSVIGFLAAGILLGPSTFGIIGSAEEVKLLAEIGVILLLFTIGIEFSLQSLRRVWRTALLAGFGQMGFTILLLQPVAWWWGLSWQQALFVAAMAALSSTAIVLRILQERGEIEAPHGQLALALLIFQDLMVIPLLLFTPALAGSGSPSLTNLFLTLLKAGLILALVMFAALRILPGVMFQIARLRNRELFMITVFFLCFGVSFLSAQMGLSVAMGAFLAGLMLSESEYGHQALSTVLPFKEIFTGVFFISIGMMLNPGFLLHHLPGVIGVVVLVLAVKIVATFLATMTNPYSLRSSLLVSFSLAQVGEFSFLLAILGMELGLLDASLYNYFVAVTVLSMAFTPLFIQAAPRWAGGLLRLKPLSHLEARRKRHRPALTLSKSRKTGHLVIIGYGVVGKNVALAAQVARIPFLVIEMNVQTVLEEQRKGTPILYGDATHEGVLHHAAVEKARAAVIAIADPIATRQITAQLRRMNAELYILVRTRFLSEVQTLQQLGADEVIPEEFETAIEAFVRILTRFLVPRNEIELLVEQIRANTYQMLRTPTRVPRTLRDLKIHFPHLHVESVRVPEGHALANQTLQQSRLREQFGITVLAILRDGDFIANPEPGETIRAGDILVVVGQMENLNRLLETLSLKRIPEGEHLSPDPR